MVLNMASDPSTDVAELAQMVVDVMHAGLGPLPTPAPAPPPLVLPDKPKPKAPSAKTCVADNPTVFCD
jgi:hypothetical protein